jgi:hypothetical protein
MDLSSYLRGDEGELVRQASVLCYCFLSVGGMKTLRCWVQFLQSTVPRPGFCRGLVVSLQYAVIYFWS